MSRTQPIIDRMIEAFELKLDTPFADRLRLCYTCERVCPGFLDCTLGARENLPLGGATLLSTPNRLAPV